MAPTMGGLHSLDAADATALFRMGDADDSGQMSLAEFTRLHAMISKSASTAGEH